MPSSSSILPARTLTRRWRNSYRPRRRSIVSSRVHSSAASSSSRSRAAREATHRARISSASSSAPSSCTPRRRIRYGSVSPWPTTVTRISAKVMNRIRSRSGSGAPASVSSGSASAAASETAPRIPAQADTIRGRAPTRRARCCGPAIQRPDHVGHREHEREAGTDHGGADERRVADQLAGRVGVEPVGDHRQLQPDQDEQRGVEEEDEDLPDREALQARLRRDQLGRPPAEVDAGGDGRQHAREAELVGRDEGRVGREQRDRDLGRRVVEPAPDLGDHEADDQPDRDPAGGRSHELEPRVERREARRRPRRPRPPGRPRARSRRSRGSRPR